MIDTVILSIPRGQTKQIASDKGMFPVWVEQQKGDRHKKWIKNFPKGRMNGNYYPRLTAYNRQDERTGMVIKATNIEFSVAKLLYGNNLDEVEEKDFTKVLFVLQQRLKEMGEAISKQDLENATISGFDPSKNISLQDGYTAFHVIKELGKININKKLDLTKVTFKNNGHGLQVYSKNYAVVFYDKVADLNQKKARAIDKDQAPLQVSLFEDIKAKQPFLEVLRLEVRIRNKQKLNSIFKALGFKQNPTFRDIFKKDVCQKVVRWYWGTIIKGENMFLFELENNPKRTLRKILKQAPNIKAKEAVYLVGLSVLCKDGNGITELRQTLEKRIKQRSWYRVSDGIKALNAFTVTTELHSWVKQVEDCLQKFEPYKVNSP